MKKVLFFLLRAYKLAISPYVGGCCRFSPSCSDFMREAIELHGSCKGIFLGLKRVIRCGPWSKGGKDPVNAGAHRKKKFTTEPTQNTERKI